MSNYQIVKLDKATYRIQDRMNDSMYLLVGTTKALCIDCGMDQEAIMPTLKLITELPIELLVTHGHLDHAGTSNEFDVVYMDENDHDFYQTTVSTIHHLNFKPVEDVQWIKPGIFDLDGRKLYIIRLYGHTPGSVIICDPMYHHVYTGDAIGSGCGVWMQVSGALALDEYKENLEHAYEELLQLGVNQSWYFEGGHFGQEYQSKVAEYNRLDLSLLKDMITLNQLLLDDKIEYIPSDQKEFDEKPYYATYQKAEMVFTLSQKECTRIQLDHAKKAMEDYLSSFDQKDPKIQLKLVHTFEVMKAAKYICKNEKMNLVNTRLAVLIALLHDIGRFEQVKRFHSYEDSMIDHAKLGIHLLFEDGMIRDFIKDDHYDQIIFDAINNHSLYQIDTNVHEESLLQCKIIRDSDKLDNYRVKLTEKISTLFDIEDQTFIKEQVGSKVLDAILQHQLILKEIRVNHMDRWISYLAFLFDLNFKSCYLLIQENNYINRIIDRFHYDDQDTIEIIRNEMIKYMEEKINENY